MYLSSPQNSPGKWDVPTKFDGKCSPHALQAMYSADFGADEEVATVVKGGAARKFISEVRLHASDREVQSIQIAYTDGDATPMHGGDIKGKPRVFKLEPGEDITMVWYRTDNRGLGGLQFGTSKSTCRRVI